MKKPNQPLAEQIRRMRCRQGLNLRQVAMLSGIAESTFKCLESSRMRFNVDTLLRVQLALGLPISHLWPYRITEKKQVCEESLQAAVLSADLAWKPSVEWVLSQVVEVCKVDLKEVTNQRSTDPRILNARTVAALVVQEIEGLHIGKLAEVLHRDGSTLSNNCTEARWLRKRKTWEPVNRILEQLQSNYDRFDPDL